MKFIKFKNLLINIKIMFFYYLINIENATKLIN